MQHHKNCLKLNYVSLYLFMLFMSMRNNDAAKILGIFPTASISHQQPMLALSYALGAKGHDLTILTTNPSKEPVKNVIEIDISSLYEDWEKMQQSGLVTFQERSNKFKIIHDICSWANFTVVSLKDKPVFQQFIRDVNGTKFDLVLYEPVSYSSLLGILEIIGNPPVIGLITFHPNTIIDDAMGNPFIPSYIPSNWLNYVDRMNIYERFWNAYADLYCRYVIHTCTYPEQKKLLKQIFGDVKQSFDELEYGKSLLIVSVDFATGYPRPLQPNTIYVGPLHLKEPSPLPQDLQKWMDKAEDGVIYFSLGSNMKGTSVPENIRSAFIKAFQRFPKFRVLWKWEADVKLPGQPDNVLVKKWFPQNSVLAHPKVKLFISQCGLQSFQEAIHYGIPILGMPIFGDQEFNSGRLASTGAGLVVDFNNITFEEIYEKINDLLTNSRYKENMQQLSSISKDKPMSSMDTAIWWVEYVIRHKGAAHLRPASLDLTWYQLYMLDILLFVAIILIIILLVTYYVTRMLVRWFCSYLNVRGKVKKN